MIFLERKLIEYLNSKFLNGDEFDHKNFLASFVEKKWPRINYYLWFKGDKFKRKIEDVLDDCKRYEYIDKDYKVTKEGRDFITPLGFFEEYLKRRKRTVMGVMFGIVGYLIGSL